MSAAIPDLHHFVGGDRPPGDRDAPPRTRRLAASLHEALAIRPEGESRRESLAARIVTDAFLRSEADRDQNVYLGRFFTRRLTRAVPDLLFLPATRHEAAAALRWARGNGVPVALRGAASTAMGGAVPNDGGLALDVARLDEIEVDERERVCVIGAGARFRAVHAALAARGFALPVYPSNLGGTFAGWFATGGFGLNAFGRGAAAGVVKAAEVALPSGDLVRFHADGRLDVSEGGGARRTLTPPLAAAWFEARGWRPLGLGDFAGSEGVLGLILQLAVAIEPRPALGAFLLAFRTRDAALEAAAVIARRAAAGGPVPANLLLIGAAHLHHLREAWRDEDAREWRERPGRLSSDADLPWSTIAAPSALGAATVADAPDGAACLFVDVHGLDAARAFAATLAALPGAPQVHDAESVRFAAARFKPQMTKRLGPGLVAAEALLPAAEVPGFLPRAERVARAAGARLDVEVYYLAGGGALAIAATLTDHRRASFLADLALAPVLTELAMAEHGGRPYVLGRWQSAWFEDRFGAAEARRREALRRALDPTFVVNRGVLTGLRLRGPLGALLGASFRPGIAALRRLAPLLGLARPLLALIPGPAAGRGEPAAAGVAQRVRRAGEGAAPGAAGVEPRPQSAAARALTCVNCGECNSVCPIFHEAGIRLPQTLTHIGEAVYAGAALPAALPALLDLCMRCGNCEEVCQAGIPHLPLYEVMQNASNRTWGYDRDRHAAILSAVRGSERYLRDFLGVRKGGYLKRTPASLTGTPRYLLLRAEADAGPAATCIHCGACVPVCPTHANREKEGADPRWITTRQELCIGCGTCVEVCPANDANGGQTLRVMEAPTAGWFEAVEEFEATHATPEVPQP